MGRVLSAYIAEDGKTQLTPVKPLWVPPRKNNDRLSAPSNKVHPLRAEKGRIVGALFPDVKGAPPSVVVIQLIHNMRKWGIQFLLDNLGWFKSRESTGAGTTVRNMSYYFLFMTTTTHTLFTYISSPAPFLLFSSAVHHLLNV